MAESFSVRVVGVVGCRRGLGSSRGGTNPIHLPHPIRPHNDGPGSAAPHRPGPPPTPLGGVRTRGFVCMLILENGLRDPADGPPPGRGGAMKTIFTGDLLILAPE